MPVYKQVNLGYCMLCHILWYRVHCDTRLAGDKNVHVSEDKNQILFQGILQVKENETFALSSDILL